MRVPLLDFRDKLEDCLEARGAQEITLDRACAMVQWVERVHRCGIRYLARRDGAFRKAELQQIELSFENGNTSFLDAGGLSLAVVGPQALDKATLAARDQGMGLSIISNVNDLIGLGQLVEEAVGQGLACFASFVVDPLSEEGQILTEIYGHSRGIIGVPGKDEDLHIELYGLPASHDAFMQGITPVNMGELVVSALSKSEKQEAGCTLLVLDLPDLYENLIKGLEAGVKASPARLFNPVDQAARYHDIAEQGYDLDEADWKAVTSSAGHFVAADSLPET